MSSRTLENNHDSRWMFWFLVICLITLAFIMNGISVVPPQHYQRLSLNPFITRTDIARDNYWQENILLPILAFYTRLNSPMMFAALCFCVLILAYTLFAQLNYARYGFGPAMLFTAIIVSSPLTTILLSWLGMPDGMTFLLTIPLLFSNSASLIFFLSLLGATNHLAFVVTGFEILFLRWIAKDSISRVQILAHLVGSAVGYLLVQYFITMNDIHKWSRLDFILSRDLGSWLHLNTTNTSLTLFSFFHVQWLLLLMCTIMFARRDPKFFAAAWSLLLINYGITFFTLDQTRIFALLSWAIFFLCLFHSYAFHLDSGGQDAMRQRVRVTGVVIIAILGFILPRYYSWQGSVVLAPFWAHLSNLVR